MGIAQINHNSKNNLLHNQERNTKNKELDEKR